VVCRGPEAGKLTAEKHGLVGAKFLPVIGSLAVRRIAARIRLVGICLGDPIAFTQRELAAIRVLGEHVDSDDDNRRAGCVDDVFHTLQQRMLAFASNSTGYQDDSRQAG
jgi:hypothetical protein